MTSKNELDRADISDSANTNANASTHWFIAPFVSTDSWIRRIVLALTAVAILTTSFDLAANIDVAGYNVRLTLLASLPLVVLGVKAVFSGKDQWPVGSMWLLAWCAVQLLFSLRSPSMLNGIGYWCWLMLEVGIVFGLPLLASTEETCSWLVRLYANSFFLIAVLGFVQFALYYVGTDFYLVHVLKGNIARVNGLSYESSYYATYLLMGLILNGYLLEKEDYSLLSKAALVRNYVAIVLAIALANSRMAYLVIGVWFVFRAVAMIVAVVRARKRGQDAHLPLCFWLTIACIVAGVVMLIALGMNYKVLMRGFGIVGRDAKSSGERIDALMVSLQAFSTSPLLGYGLGGVDPIIAQVRGTVYQSGQNGAASMIGELLVANGIVGLIPFLGYLWSLFFGDKRHRRNKESRWHSLHVAMVLGLAFECFILLFNQNILRPYLWMQVAFVAVSWNYVRKAVA